MPSPVEKVLIIVLLVGVVTVLAASRILWPAEDGDGSAEATGTSATTAVAGSATSLLPSPSDTRFRMPYADPPGSPSGLVSVSETVRNGDRLDGDAVTSQPADPEPAVAGTSSLPPPAPETTVSPMTTTTTLVSTVAPPTTVPPTTTTTTLVSTVAPPTTVASASAVITEDPEEPILCAPVEELWVWDGHPVEDPCSLEGVKQAMRWAWTGTDEQRRSAIRNGHILGEVFAALDEYGRKYEAGLFQTDTRGDWTVLTSNIRWHG